MNKRVSSYILKPRFITPIKPLITQFNKSTVENIITY